MCNKYLPWIDKVLYFQELQKTKSTYFQDRSAEWYLRRLEMETTELREAYLEKRKDEVLDEMSDVLWMTLALIDKLDQENMLKKKHLCEYLYNKHGERFGWLFTDKLLSQDWEDWDYLLAVKAQQKKRGLIEMPYDKKNAE